MFPENIKWYETDKACINCGLPFSADYKHNNICFKCRSPELFEEILTEYPHHSPKLNND